MVVVAADARDAIFRASVTVVQLSLWFLVEPVRRVSIERSLLQELHIQRTNQTSIIVSNNIIIIIFYILLIFFFIIMTHHLIMASNNIHIFMVVQDHHHIILHSILFYFLSFVLIPYTPPSSSISRIRNLLFYHPKVKNASL